MPPPESGRRLLPLTNKVRPYAWGSHTAIPELLGYQPTGEPAAELWLGAHPGAPSVVGERTLIELIGADAHGALGSDVVATFGPRLPYLLKILAAAKPLSLQAHPSPEQAVAGFAREEKAGVPVDAAHRNYKDENHKPELIVALGPFEALSSLRPAQESLALLEVLGVASLAPLRDLLDAGDLQAAVAWIFNLPKVAVDGTVSELVAAAGRIGAADSFGDICAWIPLLADEYPGDPGVILALLLNLVRLEAGQGIYLDAGEIHAYLRGVGVEIMASSDNVLRCGLTPKHVDVAELLDVVSFESRPAIVLEGVPVEGVKGLVRYETPAADFRLDRLDVAAEAAPVELTASGPAILLCLTGTVILATGDEELVLRQGESVFVLGGAPLSVTGSGTIYRATDGL